MIHIKLSNSSIVKLLLGVGFIAIMHITNPTIADFNFYVNNEIKELYPKNDASLNTEEGISNTFIKIYGNLISSAVILETTQTHDYFIFSTYFLDTSFLRLIDSQQKNIKVIGIFGTFFSIN